MLLHRCGPSLRLQSWGRRAVLINRTYAAARLADPRDHDVTEKSTPSTIDATSAITEAASAGFVVIK